MTFLTCWVKRRHTVDRGEILFWTDFVLSGLGSICLRFRGFGGCEEGCGPQLSCRPAPGWGRGQHWAGADSIPSYPHECLMPTVSKACNCLLNVNWDLYKRLAAWTSPPGKYTSLLTDFSALMLEPMKLPHTMDLVYRQGFTPGKLMGLCLPV